MYIQNNRIMKDNLITKIYSFILIICCVFMLSQCDKNDFSDSRDPAIDPFFEFSSVAFLSRITDNSGDWSLCTIESSGKNMRKIFNKKVECQKPARSYSGTKLLFTAAQFNYYNDANNTFYGTSEYELCIINIDGTGLTIIDRIDKTEDGRIGHFAWSPDDNEIVYTRSYESSWDKSSLILYNISNNTHTVLQTEGNVCSPKFSPDGKQIIYCTTVETEIFYIHSLDNHQVYKMDINEKNNKLIIKNAASPQWSPQGDKIMFTSIGKDGSSQISVANADGSDQKQLTSSVDPGWWDTGFPRGGNTDPQWTPDGKKIVYVSNENEKPEIFIMNSDGSEKTRLTKAEFSDREPEVTPDGKYIIFTSWQPDMIYRNISVMNIDGSGRREISKEGSYPIACR